MQTAFKSGIRNRSRQVSKWKITKIYWRNLWRTPSHFIVNNVFISFWLMHIKVTLMNLNTCDCNLVIRMLWTNDFWRWQCEQLQYTEDRLVCWFFSFPNLHKDDHTLCSICINEYKLISLTHILYISLSANDCMIPHCPDFSFRSINDLSNNFRTVMYFYTQRVWGYIGWLDFT